MTVSEQYLILFLRVTAALLVPAVGAVVMPYPWMNALHEGLGLGTLPELPLVAYLTRSLSALYVMLAAWCWFLSNDVRRYLPLLRFSVPVTMAFGATLIAIDVLVAMPTWWTLGEAMFMPAWTLTLWQLVRRIPSEPES